MFTTKLPSSSTRALGSPIGSPVIGSRRTPQPGNVELAGAPIDQDLTGELDSGFYRNDQAFDIFIPDLEVDETREQRSATAVTPTHAQNSRHGVGARGHARQFETAVPAASIVPAAIPTKVDPVPGHTAPRPR